MNVVWVFIGGGLGSVCRYWLGRHFNADSGLPWGTFLANALSCILLGYLLAQYARTGISPPSRWLLAVGFCGGFSTFSTFSGELVSLYQAGGWFAMATYLLISLICGVLGILLGAWLAEMTI